jgi:hypothetical protein
MDCLNKSQIIKFLDEENIKYKPHMTKNELFELLYKNLYSIKDEGIKREK